MRCEYHGWNYRFLRSCRSCARSGVKNPIQVALHLAKEQMSGPSLLGRIPPMFLVGEGACQWAKCKGIDIIEATSEDNNWLVTENAKAQWVKYSALLASAKELVNRSTASASESSSLQLDPSGRWPGWISCYVRLWVLGFIQRTIWHTIRNWMLCNRSWRTLN
uniref:Uncharacterized protein n=1 Tax=Aegilops tauschii subsp. strangulata TaxID=200361 RepID=A0A453DHM6_AEGTS